MLQKEKQAALEKETVIKQLQQEVQALEKNLKNSEDDQLKLEHKKYQE